MSQSEPGDTRRESPEPPVRGSQKDFVIHRRTWEIELLISGAVVFTLLRVPAWLDRTFEAMEVHLSRDLFFLPYFTYYGLKLVSYVLISAFVAHLIMRAYWIGLIGLEAVFPDGINWKKVDFGPVTKGFYRGRLPKIPQLIRTVDRIGSSIFSLSFFFVLLFIYIGLLGGFLALPAAAIDAFFFSGERFSVIIVALFFLTFLPSLVATGLDKLAAKRSYRWGRSPAFRSFVRKTLGVFYFLTPSYFTSPIQFTFFSRLPKKYLYPAMNLFIFALVFLFAASLLLRTGAARFDSYLYFHDEVQDLGVDPDLYESLREPGKIFRITPAIQSDVIEDPFIKLFLPYSPRHHNEDVERACPEIDPLQEEGLSMRARKLPEREALAEARRCLGELWEVALDGETLDRLEFELYRHPKTDVRGLVAYIPTAERESGRHLLEVRRRHHDEDLRETRRVFSIPFWL